jgi:hypothetical protein
MSNIPAPLRLAALVAIAAISADAQFLIQRMAISSGRYNVPAGGSVRIASICLDASRDSPHVGDGFRYSYGAESSSRVRTGQTKPIAFAEALSQGALRAVVGADGQIELVNPGKQLLIAEIDTGQVLSIHDEPPDSGRLAVASGFRAPVPPKTPRSLAIIPDDDDSVQLRAWEKVRNSDTQILLRDLAGYSQPVDGKWGPHTREALAGSLGKWTPT